MKKFFKGKFFASLLAIVTCVFMTLPLVACGNTSTRPTITAVRSIALDTSEVKTEFAWGEEFTYEGLKVVATMSDKTTKEVPLKDCKITKPNMTRGGQKTVYVTYKQKRANYRITVLDREMPTISDTPVFTVDGSAQIVTVEAENFDLITPATTKADANKDFVVNDVAVSEGKYLSNYGVIGNGFGFKFQADVAYEANVTVVFRFASPVTDSLTISEGIDAYLNYENENYKNSFGFTDMAVLPGAVETTEGEGDNAVTTTTLQWEDRAFKNLSVKQGLNEIRFDVLGTLVPYIDYVRIYFNTTYVSSKVDINSMGVKTLEFEQFDLSKIVTRSDIVSYWGLKPGEAFVEAPTDATALANTSGGKSVGAVANGTEISTTLVLADKATVDVYVKVAYCNPNTKAAVYMDEVATFYVDGVAIEGVEHTDIHNTVKNNWWGWITIRIGSLNLEAGNHSFEMKVNKRAGATPNYDCFTFDTISYGSFKTLSDLELDTTNVQKTFVLGEEFNSDNLGVKQVYNTGEKNQTDNFTVSTPDLTTTGTKTVTVTSVGLTKTYDISVIEKTVSSVVLNTDNVKKTFAQGEQFNSNNLVVTANFDDGTSVALKSNYTVSAPDLNTSGSKTVTVTYGGKSATYQINVDGYFDVEIAGTAGTTTYQMENIDHTRCTITTRNDFINVGIAAGNVCRGQGRIYGWKSATFRLWVKVDAPCTIKLVIAGFGDSNLADNAFSFGGQSIVAPAGTSIAGSAVKEAVIGNATVAQAGTYVFEFYFGMGVDLDYVSFIVE